jgi:4-hydroxy-3-polyprenylbenzoate decarboxylase
MADQFAPDNRLPLILGITGASGAVYGLTLARMILESGTPLSLLVTEAGKQVIQQETRQTWEIWRKELAKNGPLDTPGPEDWRHPCASGSALSGGMVVAPCSMGTLGRIAGGISGTLLERAADVCLKERRPLVLLARETPLSVIHLENMLRLARAGAVIMPPVPAFYTDPGTVEDLVVHTCHRVLDQLGRRSPEAFSWGTTETSHG